MADERRCADRVTVPHVVGLTITGGQRTARDAGLVLAAQDADGPALGTLVWPRDPLITSQTPASGVVLYRWDSVIVTYAPDGGSAGVREPRRPPPSPTAVQAEQRPQHHD